MPLDALQAAVTGGKVIQEYSDGLDNRLAINAGFSVGHSTTAPECMGEAAVVGGKATEAQIAKMAEARPTKPSPDGALGFTTLDRETPPQTTPTGRAVSFLSRFAYAGTRW